MLVNSFRGHFLPLLLFCFLSPLLMLAQGKTVSGKVISAKDNTPLGSVSVTVKGTNTGTVTDEQGNYHLNAPNKNATLVFSYLGYTLQEIQVGSKSTIDIGLQEAAKKLDEVIVVGYGQQKRRDITGAISSVSSKALSEVPVNSPAQALQGRIAGLDAVTTGNQPGSDVTIRIRGNRSFSAGNDPLYVVMVYR